MSEFLVKVPSSVQADPKIINKQIKNLWCELKLKEDGKPPHMSACNLRVIPVYRYNWDATSRRTDGKHLTNTDLVNDIAIHKDFIRFIIPENNLLTHVEEKRKDGNKWFWAGVSLSAVGATTATLVSLTGGAIALGAAVSTVGLVVVPLVAGAGAIVYGAHKANRHSKIEGMWQNLSNRFKQELVGMITKRGEGSVLALLDRWLPHNKAPEKLFSTEPSYSIPYDMKISNGKIEILLSEKDAVTLKKGGNVSVNGYELVSRKAENQFQVEVYPADRYSLN